LHRCERPPRRRPGSIGDRDDSARRCDYSPAFPSISTRTTWRCPAGFDVHPIAAASGLDVEDDGRIAEPLLDGDPMLGPVDTVEQRESVTLAVLC
jgi:hypothetical protein